MTPPNMDPVNSEWTYEISYQPYEPAEVVHDCIAYLNNNQRHEYHTVVDCIKN